MREEANLKGRKYRIVDPLAPETLAMVRNLWPIASPEGSTSHWSWSEDLHDQCDVVIVAEAWPVRGGLSAGWWLRIKEKTATSLETVTPNVEQVRHLNSSITDKP